MTGFKRTKFYFFAFLVSLALGTISAHAQRVGMPQPPPPAEPPGMVKPASDQPTAPTHIDLLEVQREAAELSKTAQTIPLDIENLKKGMLPKDVLQKLKQIEKLSKHLRNQLNP